MRRVGQGRGIGNLAAFRDGRRRGQGDRGGINGVGDLGDGRRRVDGQHQAATARGAGDGHGNLRRVGVDTVVRCQWHVDAAAHLPGRNHNDRAIGQGDGQVAQWRLGHVRGVDQYAAGFGDGRRGAQRQGRAAQGVVAVIVLGTGGVLDNGGIRADARGREANGRVNPACGLVEHHEAVATTGRTT
ncbi:hypothetical protein D3C85_711100 [compost metagenome]